MAAEPGETVVEDATCTFCGCLCDDIAVSVNGDRITEAANACALGEAWFLSQRVQQGPVCLIEGQPATLDDGIERAAQNLVAGTIPGRADCRSDHIRSVSSGGFYCRPHRRMCRSAE